MPKEIFGREYPFLKREEILTFEEITRLAEILVTLGVEKIRLTGGEPLVRREVEHLVEMLAGFSSVDLTMTTNGALLRSKAQLLKKAGLKRISVSLDSLDDTVFKAMNDIDFPVAKVLDGIEAAFEAGLLPIKINMVVKRGVNEDSILPMARAFRRQHFILRFIEYMDVGTTNGWRLDEVVPARAILELIDSEYPIEAVASAYPGEVARRYRYTDGMGEIGIIASVTQPFCGDCSRLRLSADGSLYTCLFAVQGHDLRDMLRDGTSDQSIADFIRTIWNQRRDRYSELRSADTDGLSKVEMSFIGG